MADAPRLATQAYTFLSDAAIVATGLAKTPEGIAAVIDIQRALYEDQPADTADVQKSANTAQASADSAQTTADGAQMTADGAQDTADQANANAATAQARADAAYTLADGKVSKDATPVWAAPTGALARTTLAVYAGGTAAVTYDPVQMQALMDSHAAWTQRMAALLTDLIGNDVLKTSP